MFNDRHDRSLPALHQPAGQRRASRQIWSLFRRHLSSCWASSGRVSLLKHNDKPIFIYLMDAYGYFTPGIATMFLLGILWKRTTHAGAMTAGLLTIPLSVGLQHGLP